MICPERFSAPVPSGRRPGEQATFRNVTPIGIPPILWALRSWLAAILVGLPLFIVPGHGVPGHGVVLGGTPSAEEALRTVKAAISELCPTKSIESLAQVMLESPKWFLDQGENGLVIVSAVGKLSYPNPEGVVVRIRYLYDGAAGVVHFESLDMLGIVQADTLYADMAKKACRR